PNGWPGPSRTGQLGPYFHFSVGKGKLGVHPGGGIGLGGSVIGVLFLECLYFQSAVAHKGIFGPVDIVLQFPVMPTAIVRWNDLVVPFLAVRTVAVVKLIRKDQRGEGLIGTEDFHLDGLCDKFPALGIGPGRDIVGMGAIVQELVLQDPGLARDLVPTADPKGIAYGIVGRGREDDLAGTIP